MMTLRKSGLTLALIAPLALVACTEQAEDEIVVTDVEVIEDGEVVADAVVVTETTEADAVVVTDANDTCGAAAYQQFVDEVSPEITLPAGTVFRHYRTGDAVTADMNPTRLNFEYDRTGALVSVTCG
ncbi:hypothetical protein [Paracoccus aerodenitrificans]|uniref:hypothetical protein n=1 Tax=Paracoccus aerodenitrificans TaxID=3017781 RepID=UPI0022F03818|nr:hypothetical protein [Paracoccus aerodenitrificans]WBU65406.1 hypothetical protein PAE61_08305 [Paracoccus aerodenitrificans]